MSSMEWRFIAIPFLDLGRVDKFTNSQLGACLGGRGNVLSMRYCGLVPAETRSALLRLRFLSRLRSQAADQLRSLAVKVYLAANADRNSCLRKLGTRCPFYARWQSLLRHTASSFGAGSAALRTHSEAATISAAAIQASLRHLCWTRGESRSKLLPIQTAGLPRSASCGVPVLSPGDRHYAMADESHLPAPNPVRQLRRPA